MLMWCDMCKLPINCRLYGCETEGQCLPEPHVACPKSWKLSWYVLWLFLLAYVQGKFSDILNNWPCECTTELMVVTNGGRILGLGVGDVNCSVAIFQHCIDVIHNTVTRVLLAAVCLLFMADINMTAAEHWLCCGDSGVINAVVSDRRN